MTEARRRQLTLVAMCISQGMILLDITIVNIALPSIQRQLHMSPDRLEWVISAYALSLATLIPLGGTLGDRYGRKRVFLLGMVVFMAGSAACALSPTDLSLIGARVVQGVGGAVMSALTLSILTETFPAETRSAAIGTWAAAAGLGFGSGPVIGGLLLSVFGWSSVFWVNVPLAVVGLLLAARVVRESRDPVARRLDAVGVATSAAGLFGVTYGLIESSDLGWGSWGVVVPVALGGALLVAFAVHEHRTAHPMLPPRLLHAPSFVTGCSVFLVAYVGLAGAMFYATLLFQDVKGWSALETGLSWVAMNLPFLVVAQLSGRLHRRFRSATVVAAGCVAGGVGIVVLGLATATTPVVLAEAGYFVLGAGYGALVPGVANVAMRDVPAGVSGAASGILNTCRQVGTSVGLAVLGAVGVS
ncbi:MAG: MFS transporter, partial [Acidimicrobiales bacterium]